MSPPLSLQNYSCEIKYPMLEIRNLHKKQGGFCASNEWETSNHKQDCTNISPPRSLQSHSSCEIISPILEIRNLRYKYETWNDSFTLILGPFFQDTAETQATRWLLCHEWIRNQQPQTRLQQYLTSPIPAKPLLLRNKICYVVNKK